MGRCAVWIGGLLCLWLVVACDQHNAQPEVSLLDETLSVEWAWIRTAPPSSGVLGGYMQINNGLEMPLRITGARSQRFQQIEFHQMTMQAGQMQMRRLSGIDVAAQSQFHLAPGKTHLMLLNPLTPVVRGERIPVKFDYELAGGKTAQLDVWFLVRDKGPADVD